MSMRFIVYSRVAAASEAGDDPDAGYTLKGRSEC